MLDYRSAYCGINLFLKGRHKLNYPFKSFGEGPKRSKFSGPFPIEHNHKHQRTTDLSISIRLVDEFRLRRSRSINYLVAVWNRRYLVFAKNLVIGLEYKWLKAYSFFSH